MSTGERDDVLRCSPTGNGLNRGCGVRGSMSREWDFIIFIARAIIFTTMTLTASVGGCRRGFGEHSCCCGGKDVMRRMIARLRRCHSRGIWLKRDEGWVQTSRVERTKSKAAAATIFHFMRRATAGVALAMKNSGLQLECSGSSLPLHGPRVMA